jgi:hypothetical protein
VKRSVKNQHFWKSFADSKVKTSVRISVKKSLQFFAGKPSHKFMDFVIYVGSTCLHVYICTQKSDLCSELFVVCIGMGGLGRKMAYNNCKE